MTGAADFDSIVKTLSFPGWKYKYIYIYEKKKKEKKNIVFIEICTYIAYTYVMCILYYGLNIWNVESNILIYIEYYIFWYCIYDYNIITTMQIKIIIIRLT